MGKKKKEEWKETNDKKEENSNKWREIEKKQKEDYSHI